MKKYEARTEQEAIEKVKDELGVSALILNIKKTQPKGLFAFFRKPVVEVTAAYDEKCAKPATDEKAAPEPLNYFANTLFGAAKADNDELNGETPDNQALLESLAVYQQKEKIKTLEERLETAEDLLTRAVSQLSVAARKQLDRARKYENNLLQVFYDTLVEQGVTEDIAQAVLVDISSVEDDLDLSTVVKVVYNKLVGILGEATVPEPQKSKDNSAQVMIFIGPTGVGKTTTIAKMSSLFILSDALNVGFITADTYRIAAVEQLKIYAEILNIETSVVYNSDDLAREIKKLGVVNDVILVDTAGRSHKNADNIEELKALLSQAPGSECFLVLSATTKHEDLINVIQTYSQFADFSIIFTKLDETACLGAVLNVCYLTGKRVAYVTTGQNVPDDIERMRPEKIAKALMGLEGVTS